MGLRYTLSKGYALAAAVLLVAVGPASAAKALKDRIVVPVGFQLFCLKSPEFCEPGGSSQVQVTPELLELLAQVNRQINRAIRPQADGRVDKWTLNAKAGDCEDYVLAKRQRLMALGLSSSALRIAQVRTSWGENHAVLVVHTDQGDLALDNLSPAIRKIGQSGYHLIAMSTEDPRVWE
jgi:predicted transglutaminase-like cysteine proteinase